MNAVVPRVLNERFRLRLRVGKSGTPPTRSSLGRSGYSTSGVLLFRVTPPAPPAVNGFKSSIDFFLGVSTLMLGRDRRSYGAIEGESPAEKGYSHASFLIGLRIGAGYGIDLE